jgi:hypothetical protein
MAAILLLMVILFASTSMTNAATFASRSIKISNSTPSATNVQYEITVTPQATGNVLGLVLEFCDNSPLDGDATCTATAGTDVPDVSTAAIAGWTLDAASTSNRAIFTIGSNSWTASTPVTLSMTGVTNPSNTNVNATFYARFYSYTTAAAAIGYTTANPSAVGAPTDFGGFALSSASKLTVTAKVQEKLAFCVFTSIDCAAGGTAISLGNSGVLDETTAYHNDDAKFTVYTNAQSGVVIRAKTFASPGHTLTSGSNTITAIGGTAASSGAGSEQYGFCVKMSGGSVTADSPYNNVNCDDQAGPGAYTGSAQFALDTAATQTTFGDDVAHSDTATATSTGILDFLANISITTESGIYTHDLNLIATGTF